MVKSDILLDDEGIDVIPAAGSLNIATATDRTSDIELSPADGAIRIGGGAGDGSSGGGSIGQIQLANKAANPRIFVTADGAIPPDPQETAVFISSTGLSEKSGQITLKRIGEDLGDATIRLNAQDSQITLGGPTGDGDLLLYREGNVETMHLSGEEARIRVGGTDTQGGNGVAGSIALESTSGNDTVSVTGESAEFEGAGLRLGTQEGTPTITVDGGVAHLKLGDGDAGNAGIGGSIDLHHAGDEPTVLIDGGDPSADGGRLELRNALGETIITLDGGSSGFTLGSLTESGSLSIGDGDGMIVELSAENGAVTLGHSDPSQGELSMELKPETGIFSLLDGDVEPVFRVDAQAKRIDTAKGFSRGTIGSGPQPGGGNR